MTEQPNESGGKKKKKALGRGLDALLGGPDFAAASTTEAAAFAKIPLSEIRPNPDQARRSFAKESLEGLAQSIKSSGILQPLVVRRTERGYELIAGERRLRAAKLAGLTDAPCVISDGEESGRLAASLIENLQREDLNPIEAAEGISAMIRKLRITHQEAADALGMSRPALTNALRLLDLPGGAIELVRAGELSAGAARALLTLPKEHISKAAAHCASNALSVRQVEEYVRKILEDSARKKRASKDSASGKTAIELSARLTKHFGTKVVIRESKDGGSVVFKYYSNEDLERLLVALGVSEDPI